MLLLFIVQHQKYHQKSRLADKRANNVELFKKQKRKQKIIMTTNEYLSILWIINQIFYFVFLLPSSDWQNKCVKIIRFLYDLWLMTFIDNLIPWFHYAQWIFIRFEFVVWIVVYVTSAKINIATIFSIFHLWYRQHSNYNPFIMVSEESITEYKMLCMFEYIESHDFDS